MPAVLVGQRLQPVLGLQAGMPAVPVGQRFQPVLGLQAGMPAVLVGQRFQPVLCVCRQGCPQYLTEQAGMPVLQ
jgi:hypothetical protein